MKGKQTFNLKFNVLIIIFPFDNNLDSILLHNLIKVQTRRVQLHHCKEKTRQF